MLKRFLFFLLFWLGVFVPLEASMDSELISYYQHWKQNYVVKDQSNTYRVATDKDDKHRTVSEAQGYGMLITVMLASADRDAHMIFDGMWRYSRAHPSFLSKDLMAWEVPEKAGENDSAFDGDADIAYALILADKVWGSCGIINYKKEATKVLDAIWKKTIGKESYLPLLGDWVEQNGKKYNQYTVRTSDFMLGHFKAFYRFSGDRKWLRVVSSIHRAIKDVQHPKTGLVPDFIMYDKRCKKFVPVYEGFLEHHDGAYYYNACRFPLRVGVDALLYGDKTSQKVMQKLSRWVQKSSKNNPLNIKSGFELDGKVIGNYYSIVFVAPFGVAAMSDDNAWAKKIYENVKNRHENYYEDSVALLSMLVIGGRFLSY